MPRKANKPLGRMRWSRNKFVNAIKIITLGQPDYEIFKIRDNVFLFMFESLAPKTL